MTIGKSTRRHPRPSRSIGPRRFDAVTIALHWTTVALIVGMFASGLGMGLASDHEQEETLLYLHRSLGVVTWVTAFCRVIWRLRFAFIPALPSAMPKVQQHLAKLSEWSLYALLLVQPLTGLAQSLTRGRPFPLARLAGARRHGPRQGPHHLFHGIHEISAWVLLGLIGLHILAALFHRFIVKDDVFGSMAPWKPSNRGNKRPVAMGEE